jgi:hypothetical protein
MLSEYFGMGVRIRRNTQAHLSMQKTLKCRGCGKQFKPDLRNHDRQAYCHRKECQLLRRTSRQRLRRQEEHAKAQASKPQTETRGLQGASIVSEADIRAENPVIIGLISMITGLTDLESIEKVYRQCWLHGTELLSNDDCEHSITPPLSVC